MSIQIQDGTGKGYSAKVGSDGRLAVESERKSQQNVASHEDGQAYQVLGIHTLSAATVPILHIRNDSATHDLIMTYIRHQVIDEAGGTALPSVANYLTAAFDRTWGSGGTAVTPVNMNRKSGNAADVTAYNAGPTLAGTAIEFDRWYTKAEGDMNAWNKDGTLILGQNDTVEFSYVGDHTSGSCFVRASFIMVPKI